MGSYFNKGLAVVVPAKFVNLLNTLFLLCFVSVSPAWCEQLVDISGNVIAEGKTFSRIISLYPAHTENLVSLQAAGVLVGIAKGDDFPADILGKSRFSYRDNAEKFIAASPDLILVRPMIVRAYPQLLSHLQEAGITIVSLQPRSVAEIYDYWRDLATLAGREKEAQRMVAAFEGALLQFEEQNKQSAESAKPWIYFESIHSKMKTIAPKSIAASVLAYGGGRNVAADALARNNTNIASYTKERILSHAQKIDIYLAQQGRMNPVAKEAIYSEPGFGSIKAVQQGQVYIIEEKLVSRPTMRLLLGIERVREIIRKFREGN